ncbi:diaminopimelate epimerase [Candidatus Saccharibacteria bacterium]|nr:diaminopimelate epimerase [Candidatus Saccharibacteria bacterium]
MKKFTKMQGLGNDFIVFKGPIKLNGQVIKKLCDRKDGIGADGVIEVLPIKDNQVGMNYWNADGSLAERCGNGLRCTARFAVDNKLVNSGTFTIQSGKESLKVNWDGTNPNRVEVQVGIAELADKPLELFGTKFYIANIGNPHAITFVENIETAPVKSLGSKVETDNHFSSRTNVDFVQVITPSKLRVRVWERGDGETLACGTGMAVCSIAAVRLKGAKFPINVEVKGGTAKVWQDDEGYLRMTGPAQIVSTDETE